MVHLYIVWFLPIFNENKDNIIRTIQIGYKNINMGVDNDIIVPSPRFAIKNETIAKITQYFHKKYQILKSD